MAVHFKFFYEDIDYRLEDETTSRVWLADVINAEGLVPGDVKIVLTNDERLREINRQFLDHDYYTDVITFDEVVGGLVNGEVYISIDRVEDNSGPESVENERDRVLVHAVLHLIGYKDKSEEEKAVMRSKEDYYLNLRP